MIDVVDDGFLLSSYCSKCYVLYVDVATCKP